MIRYLATFAAVVASTFCALAFADERPSHYQGQPANTLEQAVANFSEYNNRLADILAKKELTAADMHQVHELTYTLENALEKIRDELDELEDVLEEVHEASEYADIKAVQKHGKAYLETARKVIP